MAKILVVDDNKDVRELSEELLEDRGYNVTSYEYPEKALEDGGVYDLLISDVDMPELDGFKFIEMANSLGKLTFNDGVIMVSGNPEYKERALNLGFGFLGKPFKSDELYKLVEYRLSLGNEITK